MKRAIKAAASSLFVAYLALGPVLYPHDGASPAENALPMASWSVAQIEAQNRAALHVARAGGAGDRQRASGSPLSGGSMSGGNMSGGGVARADSAALAPSQRLLPDLTPLVPNDIYTVGSRAGGDLRLKFAATVYNAGLGPLETRGGRNPETDRLEVYQYVYEGDRATRGNAVGTFNYSHRHGHLHFDGFARYELWALNAQDNPAERVAATIKVGFCLMDIKHMASALTHLGSGLLGSPGGPVYAGCREDIQGISVGWGDEYLALLYEQDLDLTGVPDGRYALSVTTNPRRQLEELDYSNNTATALVVLEDGAVLWSSDSEVDAL